MSRALIVALLVLGCKIDGSIGRDDPARGGEGDGSIGEVDDGGEADAAGDETAGTGGGGGSEEDGGTLIDLTGGAEGDTRDTETDHPEVCTPLPDDTECATCRKTNCCELLASCLAHESCTCWWDCSLTEDDLVCSELCGTDGALFGELHACTHNHCPVCTDAPPD